MTTIEIARAEATQKYPPVAPKSHYAPQKVAKDTYLIRQIQGEGDPNGSVFINSVVILGKEPVIVDTGTEANRRNWFRDVESLVDLEAVKWVFISHDDHDHTGNLTEVLYRCPNATLVSSWFQVERMSCSIDFPMDRMRWINDGETFDEVSLISPWHAVADEKRFGKTVDRIAGLDIEVALGAHTPPVRGKRLQQSYELLRALPGIEPAVGPGQAVLESMLAEMAAA